jgi:hypothetical protein
VAERSLVAGFAQLKGASFCQWQANNAESMNKESGIRGIV